MRLEPLTRSHVPSLEEVVRDGELWKLPHTLIPDPSGVAAYIDAAIAAQVAGRELPFIIFSRSHGRYVGTTRFRNIDVVHRRVEIGATWLAAKAQRTAVNTESKLLLLTHAFDCWKCRRVEFIADALNSRSRAAIERLGAKLEGVLRHHMIMSGGRQRDSVCYSLIAPEWEDAKGRISSRLRGVREA